jgi:peptidoglycan-associated lipoprotein
MKKAALVVQGVLLLGLAAGCARTPATSTSAAAPSPSGAAMTGPSGGGRGMDGSGGTRTAASTTRVPVEQFKPAAAGTLNDIHFDFDKYELSTEATQTLDANAEYLKANPKHLILIEGHCDERGTVAYNLALGERRAKATQNYLASRGIQSGRVSIISYGEERPQCSDHTEECWAKNRRAHFKVKTQ